MGETRKLKDDDLENRSRALIDSWKDGALCRTSPEAQKVDYFSDNDAMKLKAKAFCGICAVQSECLDYAVSTNQGSGVWGGMDADERRAYRKRWLATQRENKT